MKQIENVFTVVIDTALGQRCIIVLQVHLDKDVHLKNDKQIPTFQTITDEVLIPFGFGTWEELKDYYDWKKYENDERSERTIPFKFINRYARSKSKQNKTIYITFKSFCEMVRKSMKNPMTPEELFGYTPLVDMTYTVRGEERIYANTTLNTAAETYQRYPDKAVVIKELYFTKPVITKEQQCEMESGYYLVNVDDHERVNSDRYLRYVLDGDIYTTKERKDAKQFKDEDELFNYLNKYETKLGVHGYEIEEVQGMTLEEGLGIPRIATY